MPDKANGWIPGPDIPGAYHVVSSKRRRHPADGMTATVCIGGGGFSTIVNPRSFREGGVEWTLRYGDAESVRMTAASAIASYDYLLSDAITTTEAIRRLRLLRFARAALAGARN